jgi:hypothetical protein
MTGGRSRIGLKWNMVSRVPSICWTSSGLDMLSLGRVKPTTV